MMTNDIGRKRVDVLPSSVAFLRSGDELNAEMDRNPADEPVAHDQVPIWADLDAGRLGSDDEESIDILRPAGRRSARWEHELRMKLGQSYGKIGRWALADFDLIDEALDHDNPA